MTMHTKTLMDRLVVLRAEESARLDRGASIPPGLTSAIETIERQLVNSYNDHEAEMLDEGHAVDAMPEFHDSWGLMFCALLLVIVLVLGALAWSNS